MGTYKSWKQKQNHGNTKNVHKNESWTHINHGRTQIMATQTHIMATQYTKHGDETATNAHVATPNKKTKHRREGRGGIGTEERRRLVEPGISMRLLAICESQN